MNLTQPKMLAITVLLLLLGATMVLVPPATTAATTEPEPLPSPPPTIEPTKAPIVAAHETCAQPSRVEAAIAQLVNRAGDQAGAQVKQALSALPEVHVCAAIDELLDMLRCHDDERCASLLAWILAWLAQILNVTNADVPLAQVDLHELTHTADESVRLPPVDEELQPAQTQAERQAAEAYDGAAEQSADATSRVFGPGSPNDDPTVIEQAFVVVAQALTSGQESETPVSMTT